MRIINPTELRSALNTEIALAKQNKGLKWELGSYDQNWDWNRLIVLSTQRAQAAKALVSLCSNTDLEIQNELLPKATKLHRKWTLISQVITHCTRKNTQIDPRINKLACKLTQMEWNVKSYLTKEQIGKIQLKIEHYQAKFPLFSSESRKVTQATSQKISDCKDKIWKIQKIVYTQNRIPLSSFKPSKEEEEASVSFLVPLVFGAAKKIASKL